MIREVAYDEVFDAQLHFRSVLDSMARPGKINKLKDVDLSPPEGIIRSTMAVCMSLLNRDTSFYLAKGNAEAEDYIRINTGSLPSSLEKADFLVVDGDESAEIVQLAKEGILTYPEQSATFVIQVEGLSNDEVPDSLGIEISGPGVKDVSKLFVAGLEASWIEALNEKNFEFPLGVDVIFTSDGLDGEAFVACLPRSSNLKRIA